VARQPNYGQERAERQRRKAARRDERLAAKADRRGRGPPLDHAPAAAPEAHSPAAAVDLDACLPNDPSALVRLGQALKFVCGAAHPTTLAVLRAATSGEPEDIERARARFLELTPSNQHAALTIAAAPPPLRS
jgi:hypothetical protein